MPLIVFHWQRVFGNAAQIRAALEGREITMDDITADYDKEPRYCCSAYAVPSGSSDERKQLRSLIETSGFRKDTISLAWIAETDGEAPVAALKAALQDAGIAAVHYGDVPPPFVVEVNVDGQL